jgi:hypothetical protein
MRRCPLAVAAVAGLLLALPGAAHAAAPANDNYLSSTQITATSFSTIVDTTDATTQGDLFVPTPDGSPASGGGAEPATCSGAGYGKTVWFDIEPNVGGWSQIDTAGFDAVIAVYQWDPKTAKIVREVGCANGPGPSEHGNLQLEGGKRYAIQVGGVNGPAGPAGGALSFSMQFFPDRDGDGVFDSLDSCKTTAGVERFGGCPPQLQVNPALGFDNAAGGIRVRRLVVGHVPKGAVVVALCSHCGGVKQTLHAARAGSVSLKKLVGRTLPVGASVQVAVALGPTGKGDYRYGATGEYFRWRVTRSGLGPRLERCVQVGTSKIVKCAKTNG